MIGEKFPFEFEDILFYDAWNHAIYTSNPNPKDEEDDSVEHVIEERWDYTFIVRGWNRLGRLPTTVKTKTNGECNDVSGSLQNIRALEKKFGMVTGEELI